MPIQDSKQLDGVFPALFTPLLRDDPSCLRNSIDYAKAETMIEDLISTGIQGLVPVGTTGQSATLSHKQHLDFIRFVIEVVKDRVGIIAGAGSNCTRESVEMIRAIREIEDVPMLCVTGYYNNPTKGGLLRHFQALSSETGAKIILYNVPGRTSSYLSPDVLITLAKDPNIIGLKQAVDFKIGGKFREDTARVISETANANFAVLSGEDDALSDILELGGTGIVTATGNIPEAAKIFVGIRKAAQNGDKETARTLQESLRPFVDACFVRKNPIPLGTLFNSSLYLPLIDVKDTEQGEEAHETLMRLVNEKAGSLKKYF